MKYHGGWSFYEAYNLPIQVRNWFMRRLQKQFEDEKAEMDKVSEACKKEHGEDLVPANYPEPYKSEWNELHAKEKFSAHYPFDRGNIENFAKFCLDSGGFEIC